ncbi:hypothetical protein J5X98_13570 [Leptothermofonsia sichuanensis E412]|uniref:hypothetical protein n=1 Tax=Leptothermofonsia sichuanensis TaxID=2917832 RepID=UPI001CA745CC|nr:hypothetical protein [Leptothermofonsia sichuanensis]QZZ23268.1 hypothetical protein J5X98_13570 [Leptothermofonsia sichuanensis E412]
MKFDRQDGAPLPGSKQRLVSPLSIYLLIGLSGAGLSWFLSANPVIETVFLLFLGFFIGAFAEKILKNKGSSR